jgi:hypothetical protein
MSRVNSRRYVKVPVTGLWVSPTAPRDVDAWAVAPLPDLSAWLADLDAAEARVGLQGRLLTQLERGEPIIIRGDTACQPSGANGQRWLQVLAPMQPSARDPRGYPGWVRAEHIGEHNPGCRPNPSTQDPSATAPDGQTFIAKARTYRDVPYLWGGMCHEALDCSGLIHLTLRRLGLLVPRDAADQYDVCEHILADQAQPGDLYFFADRDRRPHHVGIVTGPGRILHAPHSGSVVIEEHLPMPREDTLVRAGRLPLLGSTGDTR